MDTKMKQPLYRAHTYAENDGQDDSRQETSDQLGPDRSIAQTPEKAPTPRTVQRASPSSLLMAL